jgi:hypothetical protein
MDWEQDAYEKNERYIEIRHFHQLPSDFKEGSRLNLGGLGQVICHNIVRLQSAHDFESFFVPNCVQNPLSLAPLGVTPLRCQRFQMKCPAGHVGKFDAFKHLYTACGMCKIDFDQGFMIMFNVRFCCVD